MKPIAHQLDLPLPLLAAAVLVWGHQAGLLPGAAAMAVVLVAARWVRWRWDLGDKDFHRLADVTGIAFVIVGLYQFDALAARGIFGVLRWVPVLLFPLLLGQILSTRSRIGYSALFISVRRAVSRGTMHEPGAVDFRNPYFALCLVSAGGTKADVEVYLPSICILVALAIWCNRPSAHSGKVVVTVLVLAVGGGFVANEAILGVRRAMEPMLMDFLHERILAYRDPYSAYTAIGQIGRLKLSDRIMLRVKPGPGRPAPPLLREAVYRSFADNTWIGGGGEFQALPASADGTVWRLSEEREPYTRVTIAKHLSRGKGLVAVPADTFRIDELPVEDLFRNHLGTLKVMRGPDLVEYHVRQAASGKGAAPPGLSDLAVPGRSRALMQRVMRGIPIRNPDSAGIVNAVKAHFLNGFTYTLDLRLATSSADPLQVFLEDRRSGHCEFYATATVLLLRTAGIPARYVTGYAVSEWSELEDLYLVRRRDAHSWAMAFVDGRWVDVDTTPTVWAELDQADAGWWLIGYDFASWLRYQYARWRWLGTEESPTVLLLWLGIPLILYLAWRLLTSKRVAANGVPVVSDPVFEPLGADSELVQGLALLESLGLGPEKGETVKAWLCRLRSLPEVDGLMVPEEASVELHYRYRFDPTGLSAEQRKQLAEQGRRWLDRLRHLAKSGQSRR